MRRKNIFSLVVAFLLMVLGTVVFITGIFGETASDTTVLHYSFEEGIGNRVLDGSGNKNNGILYGVPQWSEKGVKGGCLEFDGNDNYVFVSSSESLDSPGRTGRLTVEAWLYREDAGTTGFIVKKEGSFGVQIIPWDTSRLQFAVWDRELGYVFVETKTGVLKEKVWQHIAGVCDGKSLKIYINGALIASKETPAVPRVASNHNLTVGVGLDLDLKPRQAPLLGRLDELIISNKAKDDEYFGKIRAATTEDFRSTVSAIVKPPLTVPSKPITKGKTPSISRSEDGSTVTMENSYGLYRLSLVNGVRLEKFVNNYIGEDCLNREGGRLFHLRVDGQKLDSGKFKVEKVETGPFGKGRQLKLFLSCAEPKLEVILTATIEDAPETELTLKIANRSTQNLKLQTTFPLLENIQLGEKLKDNYYFWPMHTGWTGNKSYDLGMVYGQRLWMPVMAVFNPALGGGIYTYAKDSSGTVKGLLLRKTTETGRVGIDYNHIFHPREKPQPFNYETGLGMATIYLEREMKPGEIFSPAPAAIGVNPGICLEPLRRYSEWAHKTWYRHEPAPAWFQNDFNFAVVHHRVGNAGFAKGFHPEDRFIANEQINPDGRDHHLEWSQWWRDPEYGYNNRGWIEDKSGDLYHGGTQQLRDEIKKCQALGSRITFYTCTRALGKEAGIVREHGRDWGYMLTPGVLNEDWGAFNMCTHVHEYQDHMAQRIKHIIRDTAIDGIRLDTSTEVLFCINPNHSHSQNLADDQARLLKKVREAVKSVKPDASLMVEFCGSDYFSQYVDGSLAQTFAHPYAKDFSNYDLLFFRFYFPGVKLVEWGQTASTFPVDSKRTFFNGVGNTRGDLVGNQVDYLAKTGQVMRENGDAFATLAPVPFVETKKDHLYANKFPVADKIVYTLYNKNDFELKGELIAVEHQEGYRYVEFLYDEEIPFRVLGGRAVLDLRIAPLDVICVGRLPKVLEISETNNLFTVKVRGVFQKPQLFYFWDNDSPNLGTAVALENNAGRFKVDERIKKGKLIVKLFEGEILVDEAIKIY